MNNEIQNRQQLTEIHHQSRHDAFQWFECFETLASARKIVSRAMGDRNVIKHDEQQLALLKDAEQKLNMFAAIAMRNRNAAKTEFDRVDAILFPKKPDTTDEQITEIGERMAADPTKITSNIEGIAYLSHCNRVKREAIERDGCCGGKPMSDGICFGIGQCPRHQEANAAVTFCNGYLNWLDEINELTGLAGDTARQDVSSSVSESEVSHV